MRMKNTTPRKLRTESYLFIFKKVGDPLPIYKRGKNRAFARK